MEVISQLEGREKGCWQEFGVRCDFNQCILYVSRVVVNGEACIKLMRT